jgi:hypothetical protein
VLNKYLHKGVLVHSFLDKSGCVFLDLRSGETISVLIPAAKLVKILSGDQIIDEFNKLSPAITSLISKNIFMPIEHKKY